MYAKYMKRLLDILLSLTILIVLSPLLLVLCILVRSKLGSPIFFKQERPGLHEKIFTMYKFRTMTDKRDAGINCKNDTSQDQGTDKAGQVKAVTQRLSRPHAG